MPLNYNQTGSCYNLTVLLNYHLTELYYDFVFLCNWIINDITAFYYSTTGLYCNLIGLSSNSLYYNLTASHLKITRLFRNLTGL